MCKIVGEAEGVESMLHKTKNRSIDLFAFSRENNLTLSCNS